MVMRKKYGKLLMNVGNAVEAIIESEEDVKEIIERLERKLRRCILQLISIMRTGKKCQI